MNSIFYRNDKRGIGLRAKQRTFRPEYTPPGYCFFLDFLADTLTPEPEAIRDDLYTEKRRALWMGKDGPMKLVPPQRWSDANFWLVAIRSGRSNRENEGVLFIAENEINETANDESPPSQLMIVPPAEAASTKQHPAADVHASNDVVAQSEDQP